MVGDAPSHRWSRDGGDGLPRDLGGRACGTFFRDPDGFDPLFFNITPREVADVRQRRVLEECWRALEDAGCSDRRLGGTPCGVFIGVERGESASGDGAGVDFRGTLNSMIPARIAYFLDLTGPTLAVDTACSSSLVAVHLACQSLQSGESELALAGGVHVMLTPQTTLALAPSGMLSPSGRCRTFDAAADGMVLAEGVGVLVLKRLSAALADGDPIYGVIRGSGINSDGKTSSATAPSALAQTALECAVYERSGVRPDTIDYVEAHGTGTPLGDPIEFQALTAAFRRYTDRTGFCAIGSVKANMGHAAAAAGVAGLIKVLLALRHGQIPPLVHFSTWNPHIDAARSPFHVNTEAVPWPRHADRPRRAAVSAFGASGTNCHVVVEEARTPVRAARSRPVELVTLSAKTPSALKRRIDALVRWIQENDGHGDLHAVSYTLNTGRSHFAERLAVVAPDLTTLAARLQAHVAGASADDLLVATAPRTAPPAADVPAVSESVISRAEMLALARHYVAGGDIDWDRLYPHPRPRRVPLPTYTFDRDAAPAATDPHHSTASRPEVSRSHERLTLVRELCEVAIPGVRPDLLSGAFVLLVRPETPLDLVRGFQTRRGARCVIVRAARSFARIGPDEFDVPLEDGADEGRAAEAIVRAVGSISGLIDLLDVFRTAQPGAALQAGRVAILQKLVAHHLEMRAGGPLRVLHVTPHMSVESLGRAALDGSWFGGIVSTLGSEYERVRSRTVEVDERCLANVEVLDRAIAQELSDDSKLHEVCYRRGRRFVRALRTVDLPDARPQLDPDRVYVVTGGTGEIGAAVAAHLVELGARRLVMTGSSGRSPRREPLERMGAHIEVYVGSHTDVDRLQRLCSNVRRTMGPIAGVVHCAGRIPDRVAPFLRRGWDEMTAIAEPKIAATEALSAALSGDDLDFFLLFSSVSAVAPRLGAGLIDYAAANRYLAAFAEYEALRGVPSTRALLWPAWADTRRGRDTTPIFREMGLVPLTTSDALGLLDRAIGATGIPVVLPCVVEPEVFDGAALTATGGGTRHAPGPELRGASPSAVEETLRSLLAEELQLPSARLRADVPFGEFGVDSILIAQLVRRLEELLGRPIDPSVLLEHPTLERLARYLHDEYAADMERIARSHPTTTVVQDHGRQQPVAIVGLACHFPAAPDKETFWSNLRDGRSAITPVPASRWDVAQMYSATPLPGTSVGKWGGFISGLEDFDPKYFQIPEDEAAALDPAQRQFLEVSAESIADAGYARADLAGRRIGVFVGARMGHYSTKIRRFVRTAVAGAGQNFIAALVSHFYDFRGPSLVVDTACSSSLVSVHLACQSLATGECDAAIAGGVDILLDEKPYLLLSEGKALSPDGVCRTFDLQANGMVPGEGAGAVVLKRLEDALRDGDRIHAVIEGSAVNNDGRTMGLTTPNHEAQQDAIQQALERSGASARSLSYFEAHGTGTMIGDPIELRALTRVFRRYTADTRYCAVASVKSNIGHLLCAAGIASLVKMTLALAHREKPPTLNCVTPNPRFEFDGSPFYPITALEPWTDHNGVRRAGISSFGFGGTNCVVILADPVTAGAAGHEPRRAALPPIAFERRRFWIESELAPVTPAAPIGARRETVADLELFLDFREQGGSQGASQPASAPVPSR